jgi:hypothetical protein
MSQMQTVTIAIIFDCDKMWSFYRFLHFIATKGRLNPASERTEVAILRPIQVMTNLRVNS